MESGKPVKDTETMPKLDSIQDSEKLKSTDYIFMKRAETHNILRARQVQRYRKSNNITAISLGLCVVGIYCYTIYAVKQEKFLDDLQQPEKVYEK